jgi:DNA-binding transcriptional MerR regulator
MTVAQLAQQVGLHVSTIRRLEQAGIVKSERDKNGWRIFDESAVRTLRTLYKRVEAESLHAH